MPDSGSQSNPKRLRTLSRLRHDWAHRLPRPCSHHWWTQKQLQISPLRGVWSWEKALLWSLMKFKSNRGSGSIGGISALEQETTARVNTCQRTTKSTTGFSTLSNTPKICRTWVSLNPENLCYGKTFMADIPYHTSYFYTSLVHTRVHRGALSAMHGEAAPVLVPAPHLPALYRGMDGVWAAEDDPDQLPTVKVTSNLKTAKACWWDILLCPAHAGTVRQAPSSGLQSTESDPQQPVPCSLALL